MESTDVHVVLPVVQVTFRQGLLFVPEYNDTWIGPGTETKEFGDMECCILSMIEPKCST